MSYCVILRAVIKILKNFWLFSPYCFARPTWSTGIFGPNFSKTQWWIIA